MILTDLLQSSAQAYGQKPALTMRMGYRTTTLSYAQVFAHARKVAQYLVGKGITAGDCVLLCAPNSPWWICAWWGCVLAGVRVVPLAPENGPAMLAKVLQQTEAKLFIRGLSVHHQLPVETIVLEHVPLLTQECSLFPLEHIHARPFDCAEIMYTSGTTGDPKGVMLTHENIMSSLQGVRQAITLDGSRERLLSILPLSHMFEQVIGFLLPFAEGAHIVYAHSHGALRELMCAYRITKIIAVPEFLKLMAGRMQEAIDQKKVRFVFDLLRRVARTVGSKRLARLLFWPLHRQLGGRLDTVASGGAPLDPELESWWDELGVWILQGYGLTETAPVVTTNTWHAHKIGSVGKPLAQVQVMLEADGEILVKGPNVFVGYFKNPDKTAECFNRDGFFKTGDMGYFDQDGFLFLKGRKKYMILGPGGQNIFPEDIETVLNLDPAVRDSCVLGVPTAGGHVAIEGVLLLREATADVRAIMDRANAQLAAYQRLSACHSWPEDDFPRSVTRKIKREAVLAALQAQAKNPGSANDAITPLARLIASIAGVSVMSVKPTASLMHDLHFDSLMRVELVSAIEEQMHVLIDETAITANTTVEDVQQLVQSPQAIKKPPRAARWPRAWWAYGIRRGLQAVLGASARWFFRLRVEGAQHLSSIQGPVIFMPNHVSLLDGLIMAAALPGSIAAHAAFAAGYDVLYGQYRWFASFAELAFNAFPFPRKESDHIGTGLQNMGGILDAGEHVVLFPEGTLSPDGSLQPLKKGAGSLGQMMQVPIIPVKIIGLAQVVPYDKLLPRARGQVTVRFGAPIIIDPRTPQDEALVIITRALENL